LTVSCFGAKTKRGDLDLNGSVSFKDFLMLAANFGRSDASWSLGDLDGDHEVGFVDFLILAENYGFDRDA